MKRAIEKLNDKSGATLAVALLFFLMCAVVGSVLLSSAQSNAGRITELKEQEQLFYDLSSAAQVLADDICGSSVTYVDVEMQSGFPLPNEEDRESSRFIPEGREAPDAELGNLLLAGAGSIFEYRGIGEPPVFVEEFTVSPDDDRVGECKGRLRMIPGPNRGRGSGMLKIEIELWSGDKEEESLYRCDLEIQTLYSGGERVQKFYDVMEENPDNPGELVKNTYFYYRTETTVVWERAAITKNKS